MRLRQPLRAIGKHKAELRFYHEQERAAVMIRSRGRCENPKCTRVTRRLSWCHIFGRRHIVGEPYCSSRHLTMGLCDYDPLDNEVGCHKKIDLNLDPSLRNELEEIAARRFYDANKARYPKSLNPTGAVRKLATKLEKEAA